jgi:Uma2 family endonuclease
MPGSVTQFADGFPRRAFTVDEVLRMQAYGILDEAERFELIEGEIVLMEAKNYPHERLKLALVRAFSLNLPETLQIGVETSLHLSDATLLEPDLSIFPAMEATKVRGSDVLLAVEVADAALEKHKGLKAAIYAKYGLRELWVIDAARLDTHVHRNPSDGQWSVVEIVHAADALTFASAPGFAVRLGEI